MKMAFLVGGPLIVAIGFAVYSGLIVFGEVDGLEHEAGIEAGGTFELEIENEPVGYSQSANYRLEEQQTGLSDIDGLEIEQEAIEYRNGSEAVTVTKQSGLSKYTNITLRRPTGFDWRTWRFHFEREVAIQKINEEYDEKLNEMQAETGIRSGAETSEEIEGEMYQIDPPRLVIPVQ